VRVNAFPTASYSRFTWASQRRVREARHQGRSSVHASSDAQREGLAKGAFDIAYAAVDNAVAMVELANRTPSSSPAGTPE